MFLNGKLMKERAIWRWLNSGSSFDVLYLQLRIGIGSIYKGEVWSEPFWSPTAALMLVKAMGLIATGTKFNGISILVPERDGGGGLTSRSRLKGWRPVFCILLFWSHPHFCTSTIFLDFWHQSFLDPSKLWSRKNSHLFQGGPHQYRFSSKRHCNKGI